MAQAAMAAMEQAIAGLRAELQAEQQARQQLEHNTATAFKAQIPKIEELQRTIELLRAGNGRGKLGMDLLNLKNMTPETYASKEGEAWKPWAKRIKLFLNGKAPGFRQALAKAERESAEIPAGPIVFTDWDMRDMANSELHDFLLHYTSGRAHQIAEEPALDGRGFETWRRLKEEFEPRGGPWEVKVMASLMSPPKSRNLAAMYDDVVQWETRVYKWEQRTGKTYPPEFKLTNLNMMIPDEYKEEFDRRFAFESHDYDSLVASLKAYAQQKKYQKFGQVIEKAAVKDPNAMDLDVVSWDRNLEMAYQEGMQHYDDDYEPEYDTGNPSLNALMRNSYNRGRAAKGKGKGRGSWGNNGPKKGKGKGEEGGGGKSGGQPTTTTSAPRINPDIICNQCGEKGHIKRMCKNPPNPSKVQKARAAMSLEEGEMCYICEEEEDDIRPISGLAMSCCALDLGLRPDDFDNYVPEDDGDDDISDAEFDPAETQTGEEPTVVQGVVTGSVYSISNNPRTVSMAEIAVKAAESRSSLPAEEQKKREELGKAITDPWMTSLDPWRAARESPMKEFPTMYEVATSVQAESNMEDVVRLLTSDVEERRPSLPVRFAIDTPKDESGRAASPTEEAAEAETRDHRRDAKDKREVWKVPKSWEVKSEETEVLEWVDENARGGGGEGDRNAQLQAGDGRISLQSYDVGIGEIGHESIRHGFAAGKVGQSIKGNHVKDAPHSLRLNVSKDIGLSEDYHAKDASHSFSLNASKDAASIKDVSHSLSLSASKDADSAEDCHSRSKPHGLSLSDAKDIASFSVSGSDQRSVAGIVEDMIRQTETAVRACMKLAEARDHEEGNRKAASSSSMTSNSSNECDACVAGKRVEATTALPAQVLTVSKPFVATVLVSDAPTDCESQSQEHPRADPGTSDVTAAITWYTGDYAKEESKGESADMSEATCVDIAFANQPSIPNSERESSRSARRKRKGRDPEVTGTKSRWRLFRLKAKGSEKGREKGTQAGSREASVQHQEGRSVQEQEVQTEVSLARRVSVVWHCVAEGPQAVVDGSEDQSLLTVDREEGVRDSPESDGEIQTEVSVSGDPRKETEPKAISRNQGSPSSMFDFDELDEDEENRDFDRFKGSDHYEEDARWNAERVFRGGDQVDEQHLLKEMGVVTENVERIEGSSGTPRSAPEGTTPEFVSTTPIGESGRMEPPADEATSAETRREPDRPILTVEGPRAGRSKAMKTKSGGRLKMSRGITVDSGAADNVMPRKMLRDNRVRPSKASKAGVYHVAADNGRIANEGEADFPFETRDGTKHQWTFQIANVNKVLAAVSTMVDTGHRVVFDKDPDTGIDLSCIVHKETGRMIKMKRERNVWAIDAYVEAEGDRNTDKVFARQE